MQEHPKVKEATEKLLAMFESGDLPEAISRTVIFPDPSIPSSKWSLVNRLLMMSEETADARGYRQWEAAGRHVKKGSKAFYILAPNHVMKKDTDTEGNETKRQILIGFLAVPVFKVEDTEGTTVPNNYVPASPPPLWNVADRFGLKVLYAPFDGHFGAYAPEAKRITLCTKETRTFFHELAHAAHHRILGDLKPGPHAEIVAETSAAVLSLMYGLEGYTEYSKTYIEHYGEKPAAKVVMGVISEVEKVLRLIMDTGTAAESG
jgi:antirestriction protein ArdC